MYENGNAKASKVCDNVCVHVHGGAHGYQERKRARTFDYNVKDEKNTKDATKEAADFIDNYFNQNKNENKNQKENKRAKTESTIPNEDRSVRKELFMDIYEDLEASLSIAHRHKNMFKLFERCPKSQKDGGGDAEIMKVMKDSIDDARHLYHMAIEDLIKYCKHTHCMFGDMCTYMHPCNYNNLVDAYTGFRISRDQLNLSVSLSKPEKHIFTDISNFERSVNLLSRVLWFMVSRRRIGLQLKKK